MLVLAALVIQGCGGGSAGTGTGGTTGGRGGVPGSGGITGIGGSASGGSGGITGIGGSASGGSGGITGIGGSASGGSGGITGIGGSASGGSGGTGIGGSASGGSGGTAIGGSASGGSGGMCVGGVCEDPEWAEGPIAAETPAASAYTTTVDTVTDTVTGLIWQRAAPPVRYKWDAAQTYCQNLSLGGRTGWRLPTRIELQSIVDYSRFKPAIEPTVFPTTQATNFWTSSAKVLCGFHDPTLEVDRGLHRRRGEL